MIWLILAIVSYFLTAVVVVVDKFLLSSRIKNPFLYAFYVSILGSLILPFWPISFSFLSLSITLMAFVAGASFFLALFFLYSAMRRGEVSRIIAFIGGISPLFLLVLSYFFLGERLPVFWLIGFLGLISGSFLLALGRSGTAYLYSFLAAVFFALTFFATKVVFLETDFLNGFIWTRIGVLLTALILLLSPTVRSIVFQNSFRVSKNLSIIFLSNKALGAFSFLLLNYAIMLGSVALINALQGVEYVFILLLTLLFSFWQPGFIKESLGLRSVIIKILGVGLISAGVILLFVG